MVTLGALLLAACSGGKEQGAERHRGRGPEKGLGACLHWSLVNARDGDAGVRLFIAARHPALLEWLF